MSNHQNHAMLLLLPSALNPDIDISYLTARLSSGNVEQLVTAHDIVIDCTDNADTRYLLGDAAHHCSRPLVFGGAVRMEGQISVFQSSVKAIWEALAIAACFQQCPMRNRHRDVPKRAFLGQSLV